MTNSINITKLNLRLLGLLQMFSYCMLDNVKINYWFVFKLHQIISIFLYWYCVCLALISVYNKDGIVEVAKALQAAGFALVGSGGTAKLLTEAELHVRSVINKRALHMFVFNCNMFKKQSLLNL